jgi:hypothetical protein
VKKKLGAKFQLSATRTRVVKSSSSYFLYEKVSLLFCSPQPQPPPVKRDTKFCKLRSLLNGSVFGNLSPLLSQTAGTLDKLTCSNAAHTSLQMLCNCPNSHTYANALFEREGGREGGRNLEESVKDESTTKGQNFNLGKEEMEDI